MKSSIDPPNAVVMLPDTSNTRAITIIREAGDLPAHGVRHSDETVLDVELLREEPVLSGDEG
jgi:hypothetical protein